MRIIMVWITGIAMLMSIGVGWYSTLPMVIAISRAITPSVASDVNAISHINLVEIVAYVWGPLFALVVLIWMVVYGTKRDTQSEYLGY